VRRGNADGNTAEGNDDDDDGDSDRNNHCDHDDDNDDNGSHSVKIARTQCSRTGVYRLDHLIGVSFNSKKKRAIGSGSLGCDLNILVVVCRSWLCRSWLCRSWLICRANIFCVSLLI
jgi:hypothetical protein